MSLRCPKPAWGLTLLAFLGGARGLIAAAAAPTAPVRNAPALRVCADPDNLPFSDRAQRGFENRIAELIARDLHARLQYEWQRMGRGFVREYLNKGQCDLLIGVPANFAPVLATAPYYRSTYVFVVRRGSAVTPRSLNDPALRGLKIGVQALDEEYTPPAAALARRGMQNEIVGFDTIADPESIMRAVAERRIDAAIVWGPLAGYYALTHENALALIPVTPEVDPPATPFTFAIAMGVRKGNTELRDRLDAALRREEPEIQTVLRSYGVPMLALAPRPATEPAGRGE